MPRIVKRDPVDEFVGQQIRWFRMKKGMSQTALGEPLKLTFQQIQKYEKGTNRVASGRLMKIAAILDQKITAFFPPEKEAAKAAEAAESQIMQMVDTPSTMKLLTSFRSIENDKVRSHLVGLVAAIAEEVGVLP